MTGKAVSVKAWEDRDPRVQFLVDRVKGLRTPEEDQAREEFVFYFCQGTPPMDAFLKATGLSKGPIAGVSRKQFNRVFTPKKLLKAVASWLNDEEARDFQRIWRDAKKAQFDQLKSRISSKLCGIIDDDDVPVNSRIRAMDLAYKIAQNEGTESDSLKKAREMMAKLIAEKAKEHVGV